MGTTVNNHLCNCELMDADIRNMVREESTSGNQGGTGMTRQL